MDRLAIDQSKIRINPELKPKSGFPRPLDWWQRIVPIWLDVSIDAIGNVVLEPNGKRADGVVSEVTPAKRRRDLQAAQVWLADWTALDFVDAIVTS